MKKQVAVLLGVGSIGQAIIRRVGAGKHIVLADYNVQNTLAATKILGDAGFECSQIQTDLGSKESIIELVKFAQSKGEVMNVIKKTYKNEICYFCFLIIIRLW
mgnify:CR=1 FL=1